MTILVPKYVKKCIDTLEAGGLEAWCVGGAVRDLLMGKTPDDYDITTNAQPEKIMSLFEKTVPTGIEHGTVTVVTDSGNVEVTTYRRDGSYSDYRSPDSVHFVFDIDEDLLRRDFTVNAICFNPKKGIYDPVGGTADIEKRVLRAIGNPEKRFCEDALRIMRCFRFSAQLGFIIESETLRKALEMSYLLEKISVERIYSELQKAFLSDEPQQLTPLFMTGALEFVGINKTCVTDAVSLCSEDFAFRFAVFCVTSGCDCETVLKRLKSDSKTLSRCRNFCTMLESPVPHTKPQIKKMMSIFGTEAFSELLRFYDRSGLDISEQIELTEEIIRNCEPYVLSSLAVTGKDFTERGINGKQVGRLLNEALQTVIENPESNDRNTLLNLLIDK